MTDRIELGATGAGPAITLGGRTVSYAEFGSMVDRITPASGSLADLAGLAPVETLAAVFAAARSNTAVLVRAPDTDSVRLTEPPLGAWLVAMTSGTSGHPRAVVRTARSWSTSFRPLADLANLSSRDTVLLTGPLHSTLHLFAAVHTLWLGAQLTDDPRRATAAHVVPTVLADLLKEVPESLRTVVVAGSALPPAVAADADAAGLALVEYYGAAELSFVAARVAPAPLTAFPGVQVRIAGGRLWARSPYLAMGRLDADEPLQPLQPLQADDGYATVGDLASVGADGSIVIRGRGDAAVSTGGHTVLVEDVEAVLATIPGVLAVAVFGLPHPRFGQLVTAVVELTADGDLAEVRKSARTLLTGPALPRRWHSVARLPRTAGGKLARAELADLLPGGPGSAAPSTSVA